MSKKKQQAQKPAVQEQKKPSALPGSIEGLDVLDVSPFGALDLTAFQQAERKLISYVARVHSTRIENIFERREHFVVPEPVQPAKIPPPMIPNDATEEETEDIMEQYKRTKKAAQITYEEYLKSYAKAMVKYNESMSSVYQIIWNQLTLALQEELKSDAIAYEAYDKSRDPLPLWIAVRTICINGRTNKNVESQVVRVAKGQVRFSKVRMMSRETVVEYYGRFLQEYKTLLCLEHEKEEDKLVMTADMQELGAVKFLMSLDSRFNGLRETLEQQTAILGKDQSPKTLQAALKLTTDWSDDTVRKGGILRPSTEQGVKATFAIAKEAKEASPQYTVAAAANPPSKDSNKEKATPVVRKRIDWSKVQCNNCNEFGHGWKRCPRPGQKKEDVTGIVTTDDDEPIIEEVNVMVTFVSHGNKKKALFPSNVILLDTGSSVNTFRDAEHLERLVPRQPTHTTGIGGSKAAMTAEGYFLDMMVYHSPSTIANVLSLALVRDAMPVSYSYEDDAFIIFPSSMESALVFRRRGNHYVHDLSSTGDQKVGLKFGQEPLTLIATVAERELLYSKRELEDMKKALQLMRVMGLISPKDLMGMLVRGDIRNCDVSAKSLRDAIFVYGADIASLKGKTTRKTSPQVKIEEIDSLYFKEAIGDVVLCMDLMFVGELPFLVCVSRKLNLLTVAYLPGKGLSSLSKAVQLTLDAYKGRGYKVTTIMFDGEGGMKAMKSSLLAMGIVVNDAAKDEHVPEVERAIRQVKERVRGFWNTLPYQLPSILIASLVSYCVKYINMVPRQSMIGHGTLSPREIFLGRKVDAARECRYSFGEYAQVYDGDASSTNSMRARTTGAIVLGPSDNLQGSYDFLSLSTWQVLKRNQCTVLPLPNDVLQHINAKAAADRKAVQLRDAVFKLGTKEILDAAENAEVVEEPPILEEDEAPSVLAEQLEEIPVHEDAPPPPPSPTTLPLDYRGGMEGNDGITEPEVEQHMEEELEPETAEVQSNLSSTIDLTNFSPPPEADTLPEPAPEGRYNLRKRTSDWKTKYSSLFAHSTLLTASSLSIKKAIAKHGEARTTASVVKELKQLLDKGVFHPVQKGEGEKGQKVRSLAFLKEKRDDTLKTRVCADGSSQERSANEDVSSRTVSIESIFAIAAVNAHQGRKVRSFDIEGAYLHAKLDKDIYMDLEPSLAKILVSLKPDYKGFLDPRGGLRVKLDRALYGLVESAKLFYDHISKNLLKLGYKANPYDPCVFNKVTRKGNQITVCVYVDDLKASCVEEAALDGLEADLKRIYGAVTSHSGKIIDYLGMKFDYTMPGVCKITMDSMIEEILQEHGVQGDASTPANPELYQVEESSSENPDLNREEREKFHGTVQKLLYLSKRVRPDILTAVAFLTTRVSAPTMKDGGKLSRLLKYLNGTKKMGLRLGAGKNPITVTSYVDASFAVHPDMKGQTGVVTTLGSGAIMSKSSKQKLVARSSTEAELIGLSDAVQQVLWTRNFLLSQGISLKEAEVAQDNKSTIILAERGYSTSQRTRHVAIRYVFVKDRIESKEIKVSYVRTEDMLADFFTKPLQGALFRRLRNEIMNWKD